MSTIQVQNTFTAAMEFAIVLMCNGHRESVNWTGLLDWNTGLDYWTEGAGHHSSFAHAYN